MVWRVAGSVEEEGLANSSQVGRASRRGPGRDSGGARRALRAGRRVDRFTDRVGVEQLGADALVGSSQADREQRGPSRPLQAAPPDSSGAGVLQGGASTAKTSTRCITRSRPPTPL